MSGQALSLRAFCAPFLDKDAARGVVGVWRQIRTKHLRRCASEATFLWNRSKDGVLDRTGAMIHNGEDRLLSCAFPTAKGEEAA
jgi:hypothetical protein